ncbi:MAG: nuclear transport factor 2 family protein [bacterium]
MRITRKQIQNFAVMLLVCLSGVLYGQGAQNSDAVRKQVDGVFQTFQERYKAEDVDGVLALLSPDFSFVCLQVGADVMREHLNHEFAAKDYSEVKTTIKSVEPLGENVMVRLTWTEKWRDAAGKENENTQEEVAFLKSSGDKLLIGNLARDIAPGELDPLSRKYQSKKGNFSLQVPESWLPLKGIPILEGMVPDSLAIVTPDLKSGVLLGLVRLPVKMDPDTAAKTALEADEAATKRLTENYASVEAGPMSVADLKGYRSVATFEKEKKFKRMRAYFYKDQYIYFFVCDAIPPDRYDALRPEFDKVVNSFRILPPQEGSTRNEELVEKLATGAISGQTYTSKDFNCFIAAPAGWEIRTSPNPAHLVEMQYKQGKSIARLLAVKGLPPTDTVQKAFDQRLGGVKQVVRDFKETERKDAKVDGTPAIRSLQEYFIEGLGHIHVSELTTVRNGVYYLVLCQAFEPDDYEALKGDFEKIIESFGFVQ